ncbi:hypothetical protein GCM10023075_74300 [Streptosporangium album]
MHEFHRDVGRVRTTAAVAEDDQFSAEAEPGGHGVACPRDALGVVREGTAGAITPIECLTDG